MDQSDLSLQLFYFFQINFDFRYYLMFSISLIKIKMCAFQLHFIQCPFPNQIQFGLEKLHPKIAYNFPNQFQFGLERKKLILQDADSKPNSDWFGKF